MCLCAAIVGVFIFLRKQSLLGESLSHAAYPGVIIGVMLAGMFQVSDSQSLAIPLLIMSGAFISAIIGLWVIHFLEHKVKIRSDAALCFVLSSFFGIGITFASEIQSSHGVLYKQVQVYLYGQAATMTDIHIIIYGFFSVLVVGVVFSLQKELQVMIFDRDYAKSLAIPVKRIDTTIFILVVLAVVIGIRSVGVVLMSAMLIAPAAAARQFTNKLSVMLSLAAFFGIISGFLGNYFSIEGSLYLSKQYPGVRLSIPTGPMIVVVAAAICLFSLFFAPERGLIVRLIRIARFRYQCLYENVLKTFWRSSGQDGVSIESLAKYQTISQTYLHLILYQMSRKEWIAHEENGLYRLTTKGQQQASKVVRLHRLWEVYLANYLGVGAERVHCNAEEMEHILTPELEQELTLLLNDPKIDPHHQPIPPKE